VKKTGIGEEGKVRLAVLIDADNAQASVIGAILAEVAKFGEATVRRIYGDFTSPASASWKSVLQKHAIKPVQQFAYSTGKNATDSALIIDAMDLFYTGNFDGFCLVTSDSDFTGLAMRLREGGLRVIGFGEDKTPVAFRNACDRFILTEVLRPAAKPGPATPKTKTLPAKPVPAPAPKAAPKVVQVTAPEVAPKKDLPKEFVLEALEQSLDDSGWAYLGTFGGYLNKLQPDFDSRVYGYKKLSDLVRARADLFSVEERTVPGQTTKSLYIRVRGG
jgi:uncharacterized LabA/DUF88 family protein